MASVVVSLLYSLQFMIRSRASLHLEIIALRHQLAVVNRSRRPRLRFTSADRLLGAWLSQQWRGWRSAVYIVKPETVLAWHRHGFRLFWTWKSRQRTGRPTVPHHVRTLIREMSTANPLWGAPRIHGELQKLGVSVSQSTVAKYMRRHPRSPSQTWRTFLANHASPIMAADLIGSIRRECLDHVIVVSTAGLQRVLTKYIAYYMQSRTHLALEKDAPLSRPVKPPSDGRVVATPLLGGLHHRYDRAVA